MCGIQVYLYPTCVGIQVSISGPFLCGYTGICALRVWVYKYTWTYLCGYTSISAPYLCGYTSISAPCLPRLGQQRCSDWTWSSEKAFIKFFPLFATYNFPKYNLGGYPGYIWISIFKLHCFALLYCRIFTSGFLTKLSKGWFFMHDLKGSSNPVFCDRFFSSWINFSQVPDLASFQI